MPQNKSHHFVPQFLLRYFSTDGSSVGLYNLRSGKIVTGASLKHQACRDWFYGRDGKAEHALGQIEGGASTVLRRTLRRGARESPRLLREAAEVRANTPIPTVRRVRIRTPGPPRGEGSASSGTRP